MVQVKHGIKSPLVRTSRQLTAWKKTFSDAEKTAVTKNEPRKRRIIFLIQIRIGPQLRVSVVDEFRAKRHHRDTEYTEVAQKNPSTAFSAKPFDGLGVLRTSAQTLAFRMRSPRH